MKIKWLLWIIGIVLVLFIILFIIYLIDKNKDNNDLPKVREINDIKSLHYSYSVGYAINAYYTYDLDCEDKCIIKIKPNGYPEEEAKEYEVDDKTLNKIADILNKYEVSKWDGFDKSDKNVLDGNSFSFIVRLKNGGSIHASGYMKWPNNYSQVKNELKEVFDSLIKEGDFKSLDY